MNAALAKLRELIEPGLRDYHAAWGLVFEATRTLPEDSRVEALRIKVVDLLQAIEIEAILGGDCDSYRNQLMLLLDWVERQSGADSQN